MESRWFHGLWAIGVNLLLVVCGLSDGERRSHPMQRDRSNDTSSRACPYAIGSSIEAALKTAEIRLNFTSYLRWTGARPESASLLTDSIARILQLVCLRLRSLKVFLQVPEPACSSANLVQARLWSSSGNSFPIPSTPIAFSFGSIAVAQLEAHRALPQKNPRHQCRFSHPA